MSRRVLFAIVVIFALATTVGVIIWNKAKNEPLIIQIGALLPLTGPAAQYGRYCQQGISMAMDEINSSETLREKRIQVIFEDSKADPKEAVTIAKKLICFDKVPIIVCLTTSVTSAIAPVCEKSHVILLTGTVAPGAADKGVYIFRNAANLAADAEAMAELLIGKLGLRRVAMIGLNIDAHLAVEKVFRAKIRSLGGEVVSVEYGNRGDTDFRSQLAKIKSESPQALYILGYIEIAYILKQAKEIGLEVQSFGDPSMESPKVIEIAAQAAEGVIYTRAAFDPNDLRQEVRVFRIAYQQRYGQDPEAFAAQSYDSIKILFQVTAEYGSSPRDIREGLLKMRDYPGVSGKTTFLPNGDVDKPITFRIIKDNKFVNYNLE